MPHFSSELYDAALAGNAGAVQRYIVDQPDAVDAGCEQASNYCYELCTVQRNLPDNNVLIERRLLICASYFFL